MANKYFDKSEEIVDILVRKTQTEDRHFFRLIVAYHMAKVASMMHTNILIPDRGTIPVSMYALNLGASGLGKTYSMNICEEEIIQKFKLEFLNNTFPKVADISLNKLACVKSVKYDMSPEDALTILQSEFNSLGVLAFSFDSGTSPAVKQMRHMLLMANAGSINFEVDEIGSNLSANADVIDVFLELYDVGKTKIKLIKNTKDSIRNEEIDGRTPANMMWFGTPTKLFDGSKVEEAAFELLQTGFARRLIFGYNENIVKQSELTAEEQYERGLTSNTDDALHEFSEYFKDLANITKFNQTLTLDKPVAIRLIQYHIDCECDALLLKDHQDVAKAELAHRYYKAVKLAGGYAFVDKSKKITLKHLNSAIQLVEDSGEAFQRIMTRPRNYERLARYLASIGSEVTSVDLLEDLPWYPKSENARRDVMNLAVAYGYKNNIIIKTSIESGIEFYTGESLEETSLDEMVLSYSGNMTTGFKPERAPWKDLHKLVTTPGYHYCAHHFESNYRTGDNAIPGFNMIILDIDEGVSMDTVKFLLDEYTFMIATTKRHTEHANRFRVVLPMTHVINLTPTEYSTFMENVFKWLPFVCDTQTKDIARKWVTNKGLCEYNEGQLVDATLFIPKTTKAIEHNNFINDHTSLSNLERWFLANTGEGNRSNNLIRFGYVLVDAGFSFDQIKEKVVALNKQLPKGLSFSELQNTVLISLARKLESM